MLYSSIILFAVIDCNNVFLIIFQEFQRSDVVIAPNYYSIKHIQNVNNYTNYSFKIDKINEVGLVLIDITLHDWSQDDKNNHQCTYHIMT